MLFKFYPFCFVFLGFICYWFYLRNQADEALLLRCDEKRISVEEGLSRPREIG